jgi:hypothetical protein
MPYYLVAVYNKAVRTALRNGEDCPEFLNPEWEDNQYIDIEAENEDEARNLIHKTYSPLYGYVIEDVQLVKGLRIMGKTLMNDFVQSVDGVAVKGFAGAGVSAYLSNFSLVVSIMVGLATLVYVCLKVYFLYKEKFKSSE